MNSDQRNKEYNNQHMSNEHMNPHHNGSCSCNHGMDDYGQKQSKEGMANSVENKVTQNDMYDSVKKESMEHDMYHENKNYYSCSPTKFNAPNTSNLPVESIRFQTIKSVGNNTTPPRVLSAMDTHIGQSLNNMNPRFPPCERVNSTNTVLNELLGSAGIAPEGTQDFLFYRLDNNNFVIANKGNGRVLEVQATTVNDWVTTSNIFSPSNGNQRFRIIRPTSDTFRLATEALPSKQIDICNGFSNAYTLLAANTNLNQANALFSIHSTQNIEIPALRSGETLAPLPELTGLNDAGPSPTQAPRAVIGSALIPCIFINDVIPLDRRIKESPYYVLEHRQYWHRLWSDSFLVGGSRSVTEETGISTGAQENMSNTIDMSIGADWGLQFFQQSNLFSQQISSGLNISRSFTTVRLGPNIAQSVFRNPNQFTTRFSRFARAFEYQLRRT
ncbi:hypothetical protein ACQKMD_21950, partial [Viridibacillus sp. NPDC096237]|uniref:hypothetical protein n=1 Tax=Viridibacillus sp. NPDC096237 TaxID=3390721 RepID=UPI003D03E859